ncbi:MAG: hypothetical protein LBR19_01015, partial [Bifidobacteriaceae bacterium]|nr:hypothetical protein [Bifidobacteriaceae bacterium]
MTSTPHRRPLALFAALAAMCGTLAITPAGAEPTDDPATGQPAAATIDPPPAGAKAPGAAVAAPDLEAQAAAQAGAGAAAAQPAAAASDIGHSLDTQPEVATQPVLDTQTEAGSDQPSLDAAVTINCANPPDAVTDTTALSWTFTTTPATATGTWRLELRDRGGAVLDSRTSTKTNSNAVTFNLGTKAVGYYVLTVTFDNAQTWSRSVVVVPSGTPPTDVRFGLDAHPSKIWSGGYNSGSQALQRYAALWKLAGITSIRDRVSWKATTEATDCSVVKWPNTSDYEADQYLVDQGFDVVTILQDAPQCANPAYEDSNPITMPPTNYAAVYQFGRQWAQGMGQLVDHIEYWNEENTDGFFPGYPYEYANGLKAFYAGVHSVDSSLDVLLGSTSYLPGDFMTEAYANGIGAFFDTRNQHYYGGNPHFYPNDPVYLDQMVEDSIAPLEQAYATASRPGWLTEMGYGIPANTTNLAASELAQAEYVAKTYAQGFASGYERVFYFFWPAYTEGTESPVIWGVVRPGDANVSGDENSLRPAYLTLALVTRHLQGTQAVALERHGADARSNGPDGRTVYFQKTDGSIVAITWGGGSSVLNQAGITVRDVFGKTLTTSDIQGNTAPLLVSNVPAIPVTATAVEYPAATTRASTPEQLFWVEGDFTVNGQALSHRHDRNNFYQPRIEPNQTIEVTAQPHLAGANLTAGQVTFNCPHGPGLSLVSKTASGTTFTCQFKADQAVGGKSYAAAEVLYQGRTDTTRLDVEVVAATRTALKNGTACTQWTWNATGNMTQSTFTQLADCTIQIGGAATTAGDMWVFPYVRIPAADRASLATMSGMR